MRFALSFAARRFDLWTRPRRLISLCFYISIVRPSTSRTSSTKTETFFPLSCLWIQFFIISLHSHLIRYTIRLHIFSFPRHDRLQRHKMVLFFCRCREKDENDQKVLRPENLFRFVKCNLTQINRSMRVRTAVYMSVYVCVRSVAQHFDFEPYWIHFLCTLTYRSDTLREMAWF